MNANSKLISFVILTLFINVSCWGQKNKYNSDFYNFITKFSQKETKQTDNILFPLLFIIDNDTSFIKKNEWKNIDYCFGCEYSPLLFMGDSINYNDKFYIANDKNNYIISAYIKLDNKIQKIFFSKIKKSWLLTKIEVNTVKISDSESFFEFINKFASDTNFIKTRITKEAKYVTWEENPNELIESALDISVLESSNYLFKRIYINKIDFEADNIFLYIKGEGTGYHIEYYFNNIDGKWYLTKFVNIGI